MTTIRHVLSDDQPLAADHRIEGRPVVPAAAQIDLMLAACDADRPNSQWRLQQVAFFSPLVVPAGKVEIEASLDAGVCALRSRPAGDRPDEGSWSLHSRARAAARPLPPPRYLDLAQLRAGCTDEVPLSELDRWREESGIEYGPTYRAVRLLHRGRDRLFVLLRAADDLGEAHFVPPALLDSLFQCLGFLDGGAAGACLPWYVGGVEARRRVAGTVLALVERQPATDSSGGLVRGRATVCNQQGEVLLELDRIIMKGRPSGRAAAGSITRFDWRPVTPTPETGGGDALVVSADTDLAAVGDPGDREIVYLAPTGVSDPDEVGRHLRAVISLLQRCRARPAGITVVTSAAHSVTGDELVEPLHTALWGLARTIRVEYPRSRVRLIDTTSPEPAGIRCAEPELAWRAGTWYAPSLVPEPADDPAAGVRGKRFLITGGLGGIGLYLAEYLARNGCGELTLVGRTVPEDGPRRARLDKLASDHPVHVIQADVRLAGEAIRKAGRFDGVFHAAGVLRDGLLRSLSAQAVDDVLAPKIGGVHALDEAFPADARPGFVALFSSVAAVHGNLGQSAYAAANAYLDGYAARKRAQGEAWYSLAWGLWDAGMGEAVVEAAAARGIPALDVTEGLALLGAVLRRPPGNYVLTANPQPKGKHMTVAIPQSTLWHSLSEILKRTLQVEHVTADDNLLEMGLDSMMAVEVAAALSVEGLDVDPAVLFEYPDVGALLRHLESLPRTTPGTAAQGPQAVPPPAAEPVPPPVASPVAQPVAGAVRTPVAPAPPPAPPTVTATPAPVGPSASPVVPTAAATPVEATVPAAPVPAPPGAPIAAPPSAPAPTAGAPRPEPPAFVPDWDRYRDVTTSPDTPALDRSPSPQVSPGAATAPAAASLSRSTPSRTLPGRLSSTAGGTFLDRRIDDLSVDDRAIVAAGDYFYEPVVEEARGAWIKFDGRWFLNFASYSYLGLIGHDYITEQALRAARRHGTGAHGVRMLAGTLHLHRELELTIARFFGTEDAIVFSGGYITNVATIGGLVGPDDVVIGDVYNHASILDGYRLSGARVITYAHNDMADLERALRKAGNAGRLVVTDAVFSMDGDIANLPAIVELCERYDAPLMVDEAHSLGVLGATGRGITEHFGIDPARVPIKMGTLSKTVPSAGGYVAGSSDLIFALKNNARGWMFSAAATPMQVAAAKAAFEVIEAAPSLPAQLRARTERYRGKLRALGFDTLASQTPVVPIICRSTEQAHDMARLCQREGLFVQPIVYPTVPKALPRLRTIVNLSHTDDDLDYAVGILEKVGRRLGLIA